MSALADRQNPWLGLAAYGESEREFFFGREGEAAELVRLVEDDTLTVLYGVSGLGKTSLLQAGVIPAFRERDFLAVVIRLPHRDWPPAMVDDVAAQFLNPPGRTEGFVHPNDIDRDNVVRLGFITLANLVSAAGPAARRVTLRETLWEYLHRADAQFWSSRQRLLKPVLVFDQFEEIFTSGQENEERRERSAAFLQELSDLIYNRPPADFRRRLEAGAVKAEDYVFDAVPLRVVISLREDFLPQLNELRERGFPTLLRGAFRLRPLSLEASRECIERPAPELLDPGVAARLVNFLAGAETGAATAGPGALTPPDAAAPPSAIRHAQCVEPALLSIVCRELNAERQRRGFARINADLLTLSQEQILADFYERSFEGVAPALRAFVERELLSPGGYRDSRALDDALWRPGITQSDIDRLIDRRLLHYQDREGGVRRIELTHDLLCRVVRASRRRSEENESARAAEAAQRQAREEARLAAERAAAAEAARADEERRRQEAERLTNQAEAAGRRSRLAATVAVAVAVLALAALAWAVAEKRWAEDQKHRAEAQGEEALRQKREALVQKNEAEKQRREADLHRDRANQNRAKAYMAQAALGFSEWKSGHIGEARALLEDSARGDIDSKQSLRSWEWYFVSGLCELNDVSNRQLTAHTDDVNALLFIPDPQDGRREILVSASSDKTVRFWDVADGRAAKPRVHGDLGFYFSRRSQKDGYYLGPLIPGSPAARDGRVKPDRLITQITGRDGKLVPSSSLEPMEFAKIVRGPPGAKVRMVIQDFTTKTSEEIQLTRELVDAELALDDPVTTVAATPDGGYLLIGHGYKFLAWNTAGRGGGGSVYKDFLNQVAISPDLDAPVIAACFENQAGVMLQNSSGADLPPIPDQESPVTAIAFTPKGALITGTEKGTIRIWDTKTRAKLWEYASNESGCYALAPSQDGQRLAALLAGHVEIFSEMLGSHGDAGAAAEKPLRFPDEKIYDLTIAFSPSGSHLATGGSDGVVRVWSTEDGKLMRSFSGHTAPVSAIAFSKDGQLLASGGMDQSIRLWQLRQKPPAKNRRFYLTGDGYWGAAFSADGRYLALSDPSYQDAKAAPPGQAPPAGVVSILDAATGKEVRTLIGCAHRVDFSPVISPHLAVPQEGADSGVQQLLAADSAPMPLLAVPQESGDIHLVDVSDGKTVRTLNGHKGNVPWVAFGPDGRQLVSGGDDKSVRLWDVDAATGRVLAEFEDPVRAVAFSPNGRHVAAAVPSERKVVLFDLSGKEKPRELPARISGYCLRFSRDGALLVAGERNGRIRAWDTQSGKELAGFVGHTGIVWDAVFTTDNRRMISLADDGTMLLWDVKTGGKVLVLEDNIAGNGLAFSADGWRLAAVGGGSVRLWDTAMIAGKCDPPSAQFYVARARYRFSSEQWAAAVKDASDAINLGEKDDGIWWVRAAAEAELGKFNDAAADYRALLARKPDDPEIFERLCHTDVAGAGIGPENRKAYFADADKIVALAKARPIPGNVNDAAWICSILPDPPIDLKDLVALTQKAVEQTPKEYDLRSTYGTLLYRAGDFRGAIRTMHEAMDLRRVDPKQASDFDGACFDWIVLAMAHFRLGELDAARKWLWQTDDHIRKLKADPFYTDRNWNWNWSNRLEIDLLLNEAHALIKPP